MTDLFTSGPAAGAEGGISEQEQLLRMISGNEASRSAAASATAARPSSSTSSSAASSSGANSSQAPPVSAPVVSAPESTPSSVSQAAPAAAQGSTTSSALLDAIARAANMQALAEAQSYRSLTSILDPEHVIPLLEEDPAIIDAISEHLPEGQRTRESLMEQLRSPQLQQTLSRLTAAFNQGQGGGILAQLGLSPNNSIGIDGLLDALRQYARDHGSSVSKSSQMDVDKKEE